MMQSYMSFANESEARNFVEKCERDFEERLSGAVERVCEHRGVRLIGLSGPTCSGKTTAANKLIKYLVAQGKKVHVVSIDDFYYDRDVLVARANNDPDIEIDYDSEDTIDLDELRRCVEQVFTDEPTQIPKFDFLTGKRSGYTTIDADENDMFIFEGIQAIYPSVTALFRQYDYRSVYISVESGIRIGDRTFSTDEIRLMRRVVRDYNFRGATPEFTLYLWESVRANEELNIFPYAVDCDYFINSTLPFEINMLAPFLREILPQVPVDNKYRGQAEDILEKIEGIQPVSPKLLSPESLYYEFLKREE
ncbi:MAG: hypothetical protein SO125_08095 [Eubacteriales bacterium]|nr:hypothetical protein [Eubacteriales bacterium]MDY4898896.1 hypothetical protein [Eubacteriales bacterium]